METIIRSYTVVFKVWAQSGQFWPWHKHLVLSEYDAAWSFGQQRCIERNPNVNKLWHHNGITLSTYGKVRLRNSCDGKYCYDSAVCIISSKSMNYKLN